MSQKAVTNLIQEINLKSIDIPFEQEWAKDIKVYVSDYLLNHDIIISQFGYTSENGVFLYLKDLTDDKTLSITKFSVENICSDDFYYMESLSANMEYAIKGFFTTKNFTSSNRNEIYKIFNSIIYRCRHL